MLNTGRAPDGNIALRQPMNAPVRTTATVHFDSYRTYVMLFEQAYQADAGERLTLTYLDATRTAFDFSVPPEVVLASEAMRELEAIIAPVAGKARHCSISLRMDSVLAHQIPYSSTLTTDELRRLIRLEASEHLPTFDQSQFLAMIYPLYGFAAAPFMAMSVLIPRVITQVAEVAAQRLAADLQRFTVAQTAAHTAFVHNYPNERGVVALCGVQGGYVDMSVVRGGNLLYTMTISLEDELSGMLRAAAEVADERGLTEELGIVEQTGFGLVCKKALDEAASAVETTIEAVYFFGADLTKTALDEVVFVLGAEPPQQQQPSVHRLNPLRRLATTLDGRLQEYCSRVAHLLVPGVGAALAEAQAGIILSSTISSPVRL
jgi:hypothetical protein